MFKNIGGKIKTFAKVVAWIGIIASVIVGLVFGMEDEDMIIYGLLIRSRRILVLGVFFHCLWLWSDC